MEYQNIFERYEIKYLISKKEREMLEKYMMPYMTADKHKETSVRNIYFDTPCDLLVRRSIEGPLYKEKLRIRSYGEATSDSTVFIELKKKYNSVVYKRRISSTENAAMSCFLKDIQPEKNGQIYKEIEYFKCHYGILLPKIFLSYDRNAFYSPTDINLRITFDENILYRDTNLSLCSKAYGNRLLEKGMVLLEIKTASAIPLWLTGFLTRNKMNKVSFSKYGGAYIRQMELKGKGGLKYVG